MKKYFTYGIVFLLSAYCLSVFYRAFQARNAAFRGTITNVVSSSLGYQPVIVVNHQDRNLEYIRWSPENFKPEPGDSVVKLKGSVMMSVYRKRIARLAKLSN
ncbi:hypothetical protein FO440_15135 [Mucilaginibacter corticis]|uniref:Uncharacterized protein n=1 Tax=Mucilaginibacter corticis TaxID=2597670 RepID=A0A556MM96_9SPHI|nr:hypothetical protein [Mucilaginibacter corticis]TSJ41061.1 hypothetical protein FO440_15135 [Mucilaginibacter corticis]